MRSPSLSPRPLGQTEQPQTRGRSLFLRLPAEDGEVRKPWLVPPPLPYSFLRDSLGRFLRLLPLSADGLGCGKFPACLSVTAHPYTLLLSLRSLPEVFMATPAPAARASPCAGRCAPWGTLVGPRVLQTRCSAFSRLTQAPARWPRRSSPRALPPPPAGSGLLRHRGPRGSDASLPGPYTQLESPT